MSKSMFDWQPTYEADDQRYQSMLCAQYRQAARQDHGIVDPEIAEHVDLLLAQLQDANLRIGALTATIQTLQDALTAERGKTQQICRAAAATPVAAPEAPQEAFPANALRWGV